MDELTPEQLQALMDMGAIPEESAMLKQQLEAAQLLRQDALQGPQMRGNHRVQTAANPLEFLAKGVQGYRAGKDIDSIQSQQRGLIDQLRQGRRTYGDLWKNSGRTPPFNPDPYGMESA